MPVKTDNFLVHFHRRGRRGECEKHITQHTLSCYQNKC